MSNFENRERNRSVLSSMVSKDIKEEKRETKKRISLAVLPSLYEDIKKIAYVDRKSVSEIIATCMKKYIDENNSKLKEYDEINNIR